MQAAFILIAVLAALNIVVSCAFAVDKWQAQRNGRRIPRWHLVCLLWLAPFLPTVCMVWLHHKIRKRLFVTSSCLAGSLQSVGLVWWLMRNAKAKTMTSVGVRRGGGIGGNLHHFMGISSRNSASAWLCL